VTAAARAEATVIAADAVRRARAAKEELPTVTKTRKPALTWCFAVSGQGVTGVVPRLVFPHLACPAKGGRGYAVRIIPFSPGMFVSGGSRCGRLLHDRGLLTALFAGNDPRS